MDDIPEKLNGGNPFEVGKSYHTRGCGITRVSSINPRSGFISCDDSHTRHYTGYYYDLGDSDLDLMSEVVRPAHMSRFSNTPQWR